MKLLKILLYVFLGLIGLFLIVTALLPSKMSVERSIVINAPAGMVYGVVNNVRDWEDWSPWKEIDPKMAVTYEGPEQGVGASYSWKSGNANVGSGKLVITKSVPNSLVEYDMYMGCEKSSTIPFVMEEKNGRTTLKWGMKGELSFFARWLGIAATPMIAPIFDKGLKNIKNLVENGPKLNLKIESTTINRMPIISITDSTSNDMKEISNKIGKAYKELGAFAGANKLKCSPFPLVITNSYVGTYCFDAAFVIEAGKPKPSGRIKAGILPGGKVVKAVYTGPYTRLTYVYNSIMKYIQDNKLTISGRCWEEYLNDPASTPAEKLVTNVYFPVK